MIRSGRGRITPPISASLPTWFAHEAEIAPTALLLATEAAAFYVGTTFNPNGGDVMI
mgnify:CR=1 FL=1